MVLSVGFLAGQAVETVQVMGVFLAFNVQPPSCARTSLLFSTLFPVFPVLFPDCSQSKSLILRVVPSVPSQFHKKHVREVLVHPRVHVRRSVCCTHV
jgi:hypothetical protein